MNGTACEKASCSGSFTNAPRSHSNLGELSSERTTAYVTKRRTLIGQNVPEPTGRPMVSIKSPAAGTVEIARRALGAKSQVLHDYDTITVHRLLTVSKPLFQHFPSDLHCIQQIYFVI